MSYHWLFKGNEISGLTLKRVILFYTVFHKNIHWKHLSAERSKTMTVIISDPHLPGACSKITLRS